MTWQWVLWTLACWGSLSFLWKSWSSASCWQAFHYLMTHGHDLCHSQASVSWVLLCFSFSCCLALVLAHFPLQTHFLHPRQMYLVHISTLSFEQLSIEVKNFHKKVVGHFHNYIIRVIHFFHNMLICYDKQKILWGLIFLQLLYNDFLQCNDSFWNWKSANNFALSKGLMLGHTATNQFITL